jgi:hypothetical protein
LRISTADFRSEFHKKRKPALQLVGLYDPGAALTQQQTESQKQHNGGHAPSMRQNLREDAKAHRCYDSDQHACVMCHLVVPDHLRCPPGSVLPFYPFAHHLVCRQSLARSSDWVVRPAFGFMAHPLVARA